MAFYSWNIVVPAILVNTMSILVFLLPPENGEKVNKIVDFVSFILQIIWNDTNFMVYNLGSECWFMKTNNEFTGAQSHNEKLIFGMASGIVFFAR